MKFISTNHVDISLCEASILWGGFGFGRVIAYCSAICDRAPREVVAGGTTREMLYVSFVLSLKVEGIVAI